MRKIPFIKMHGAGNDFVFLDRRKTKISLSRSLVRLLMDRHFGIGGDQLLVMHPKSKDRYKLDIFNSDGSMAEMCGNGVRAVAAYLIQFQGEKKEFGIQTKGGLKWIGRTGSDIEVDMGAPVLEGAKIPTKSKGEIINKPFKLDGRTYFIHGVSMGNPHCVIFVKDVEKFPVHEVGPKIENHPFFPNRVNVEFVQILSPGHLKARVWERGAGETLACGTGACAILVAAARYGKTQRQAKIELPGGQLRVRWDKNTDHVFLSGPAEITYQGDFYF
jgi:diaminopimelate epimerase